MSDTITVNSKSKYLRKVAKKAMPEYNIAKDQVYYLVRSSANDNSYYPVVWSYEQIKWTCTCGDYEHRHRQCKHCKVASEASKKYNNRPQKQAMALPTLARGTKAALVNGCIQIVDVPAPAAQPSAEFLKNQKELERGIKVLEVAFVEEADIAA